MPSLTPNFFEDNQATALKMTIAHDKVETTRLLLEAQLISKNTKLIAAIPR
jgi:hypothetical protein